MSEAKFEFRKYHSTSTCIMKLLDKIYQNMDCGMLTGVVFLDLKKAFDTVNYEILLKKLNNFYSSPISIEWFTNYLVGRVQSVKCLWVQSDNLEINCGLLKANRLTLNATKTKYIIFGTKSQLKDKPDLQLKVGSEPIERVSMTKYLGVLLDQHLTFDDHISYIHKKATKKLGILYKAKDYLDRPAKILLYKSLILPHLDYCDVAYMNTTELNLNKLQLIQNIACRNILGVDRDTSANYMHSELQLQTLKQRTLHQAMDCFTNVNNPEAGLHKMYKTVDNRQRTTRNTGTKYMKVPNIRSCVGRKS